jgi:adenosylmethionine-8-amino-7-oxononanoate aminotransferase
MTTSDGLPSLLRSFSKPGTANEVTIVRGEGALVWDDTGKRYVDAIGSLWYNQIGHGREEMALAVAEQQRTLGGFQTFDVYSNQPAEELAARIAGLTLMDDPRVFFCTSGSEAVDSVIKIARQSHAQAGHPERQLIITRDRSYHGTNFGGTSAQGLAPNKQGWGELLPGFEHVDKHDLEAVARLFAERGDEIAAVMTEPVIGAGGVHPPESGYLEGLRRLCDDHGAYLIFDEVICGFGRLGTWFASEYFGVVPDLTTFAKGVTSGYLPLGGVLISAKVRAPLEADPDFMFRHGYTYSAHPTVCAAGLTNLDIMEREGLLERAVHVGQRLGEGLRALEADGVLAEARGIGAVWGAVLPEDRPAEPARDGVRDAGVITRAIPPDVLAICPSFVITDDQIDEITDTLEKVLGKG